MEGSSIERVYVCRTGPRSRTPCMEQGHFIINPSPTTLYQHYVTVQVTEGLGVTANGRLTSPRRPG